MAKPLTISLFGDAGPLEGSLSRAGVVASDASDKISGSLRTAMQTVVASATEGGASLDRLSEQIIRTAGAYTEARASIDSNARAIISATIQVGRAAGASTDEIRAAVDKNVAAYKLQKDEAVKAADAQKLAAKQMADAQVAAARKAEKAQADAIKSSRSHLADFGKWALLGGAGVAAVSVKGAMDLQKQMEMIHTQAGASQGQVGQLTTGVLGMAGSVGTTPGQLAQGMFHVTSALNKTLPAATRTATELKVLKVAAEGAKVGGANLVDVTNALDATLISGMKGVHNYSQTMGVLNAAVGAGDMTMQNMADALGASGLTAVAGEAGISIKQLGAAIAVMGDNNVRGAEAGTKLASAIRIMASPSSTAVRYFNALHMSATQLAQDLRTHGLTGALEDLQQHLKEFGGNQNQQQEFLTRMFGGRQSTSVRLLLQQLDRLKASVRQVGEGGKNFGKDFDATTHTLAFQVDALKATVASLADKFGMVLIPKLEQAGRAVESVVGWFERHRAAAEALAVVIGGVLSVAVGAFVTQKVTSLISASENMFVAFSKITSFMTGGMVPAFERTGTGITDIAVKTPAANRAIEQTGSTSATTSGQVETLGSNATTTSGQLAQLQGTAETTGPALESVGTDATTADGGLGSFTDAIDAARGNLLALQTQAEATGPALLSVGTDAGAAGAEVAGLTAADAGIGAAGLAAAPETMGISLAVAGAGILAAPLIAKLFGGHGKPEGLGGLVPSLPRPSFRSGTTSFNAGLSRQLATLQQHLDGVTKSTQRSTAQWQAYGTEIKKILGSGDLTRSQRESLQKLQAVIKNAATSIGGGSGSASIQPSATTTTPQQFIAWMQQHGLSSTAAAGIAGNIGGAEDTGWFGGQWQHGAPVGAPTSGYGLVQWSTAAYHAGLAAMAKRMGQSTSSIAVQEAYLRSTMSPGLISQLNSARTAAGAAAIFEQQYERAGVVNMTGRTSAASRYAGAWGSSGSAARTLNEMNKGVFSRTLNTGRIGATVANTIASLQQQQQSARTSGIAALYGAAISRFRASAAPIEAQAQTTSRTSFQRLTDQLSRLVRATTAQVAAETHIATTANTLETRLGNAAQSGTSRTLADVLGVHTSVAASRSLFRVIGRLRGHASESEIARRLGPEGQRLTAGSPQEQRFQQTVANLTATGQRQMADELVAAHTRAMDTWATEAYAQQVLRGGERLQLQGTEEKDRTTRMTDTQAAILNVTKAHYQQANDAAREQLQRVTDMTQTITDRFSGMVQAVTDATKIMADQTSMQVSGISDQAQTQADVLGERGLYGLNLVAQQLKVQADQQKAADDKKIAMAQLNLDQVTAQVHQAENQAQISLDQLTTQEHQAEAAAQQRADTVAIQTATKIQTAQQHSDSVMLAQDISVQLAQTAVDLSANASRAQQDAANAQLRHAMGAQSKAEAQAAAALATVTDQSNAANAAAQQASTVAQNAANLLIGNAQQSLAQITGQGNLAIASAQQTLTGAQNTAAIAEAQINAQQSVTAAAAQTQYAGTGTTVNIFGIPADNAAEIGSQVSWVARTQLAAA